MITADVPKAPAQWEITPIIEHRVRFERKIDRDFLEDASDNAAEWLFRTRVGLKGKDPSGGKYVLQFQFTSTDSRINGSTRQTQTYDVNLASWEKTFSGTTLILGRQPYKLADGRLISSLSAWGNAGRTFEGIRLKRKDWEFFGFKEAVNSPSNKEVTSALISHSWDSGVTTALYKQDDRTPGRTQIYTLNHVSKTKVGAANLTVEGSVQTGRLNGIDHGAFAATAQLSIKPSKTLQAYVEASAASGGSGPKSGTFDSLYSSPTLPHGMRAQVGYRNLQELSFGACFQPRKDFKLDGYLTFVNLFDSKDAWYSLSGAANKRKGGVYQDKTGASGRQVGSFFQLEATYKPTKHDTLSAGFGLFFPGSFIRNQVGGDSTTQTWGYLSYGFQF